MKNVRSHIEDLRGAGRLAVEATKGITALVEEMHRAIAAGPTILGRPLEGPARAVTGLIYGSIREVTNVVGAGVDWALQQLAPMLEGNIPGPERAALLAIVNGVLGDYLEATNNPLAIAMRLRHVWTTVPEEVPPTNRKLLVMVHGSCMSDRDWSRAGHDHGEELARELGFELVYLHYNSGLHISTNGSEFASLLDTFVSERAETIDDIVIIGHSMGGLLARSACHSAELSHMPWRDKLRAIVFLGTPHHGAPLERAGNWIDTVLGVHRYSVPLARLGKIRSAGVTDLRFGFVLDEHWAGRDRFAFAGDERQPLPLPQSVACYAIAGSLTRETSPKMRGDGMVPVKSALGLHARPQLTLAFPEANTFTALGVSHQGLLGRDEVYEQLRAWLTADLAQS